MSNIDASNYVTKQHNALSEWLFENLCIIYKASGGSCESVIGPLQENQAHIPMQLYWPEGQPTIMEKIHLIQTSLPLTLKDNLELEHIINANTSSADGLKTIKGKMDALSSNLHIWFDFKSSALVNNLFSKKFVKKIISMRYHKLYFNGNNVSDQSLNLGKI